MLEEGKFEATAKIKSSKFLGLHSSTKSSKETETLLNQTVVFNSEFNYH